MGNVFIRVGPLELDAYVAIVLLAAPLALAVALAFFLPRMPDLNVS